MNKYTILIVLFANLLLAQDIDSLLQEFESNTNKSLKTVDDRLGHVSIYSQKDLQLMQYTTINDIFKELSFSNLNKNKFGNLNLSLPGTKEDVSGFYRIFINDHEISSSYTQAPSGSWMELPIDLVDYIEVYKGNSSFSFGSQSGIFFIRIYTKNPLKENGTQITATLASRGTNSQSVSNSGTLENGWSYLAYFNNTKTKDSQSYKSNEFQNDSHQRYFYLSVQKDNTNINIGYTDSKKDNYRGYALDTNPDQGEIDTKDYFIDLTTYFLDDKSIKLNLSYDVNELKYEEQKNQPGLAVIPVLPFSSLGNTKEYYQNNRVTKLNALLSKTIAYNNNNLLIGVNFQNKKYQKADTATVDFANTTTNLRGFSDFDEEQISSLIIQDDIKLNDELLFVFNVKFDKHKREGTLDDFDDNQYRAGAIYTPFEHFGIKTFYTETSLTPSFYNIDFADRSASKMQNSEYKYYTLEGVYADANSKFSLLYNNTKIKNFIYFTPVGFINVDHIIHSESLMLEYTYELSKNNKIQLNYFRERHDDVVSNSNEGGNLKFMGEYDSFEYFTSLIYRNSYKYSDVSVAENYNFNLGITYNISKNLSLSLKGENLFDDSTESLYKEGFAGPYFSLKDYQREITFSMKWVF